MKLTFKGRTALPLLTIVCCVSMASAQQLEKIPAPNNIRNGCAATTISATALPKGTSGQTAYSHDELEHPYGGTFQFIGKTDRPQEFFTSEILEYIESNRDENDEKIIQYTETTRIRIPSKREIGRRSFKPFKTLYSFE